MRRRRARRRAVGTRTPILVEAKANARWSLDFVHDQFACGRRFRVLNIVDDVPRECLAVVPDTSISGRRVARELTDLVRRRGKPGSVRGQSHRNRRRIKNGRDSSRDWMKVRWQVRSGKIRWFERVFMNDKTPPHGEAGFLVFWLRGPATAFICYIAHLLSALECNEFSIR